VSDALAWFDPGKMTGWALWVNETFSSGQLPQLEVSPFLTQLAQHFGSELDVGWERFLILPGSRVKHDGSALRVIGVLEQVVHDHGLGQRVPQPSSSRVLGLNHLRTVGWHKRGEGHANDAAAHLLSDLLKTNRLPADLKRRIVVKSTPARPRKRKEGSDGNR
jgi:hypothetical protein